MHRFAFIAAALIATSAGLIPLGTARADERDDLARQIAERVETLATLRAQRRRAAETHAQQIDSGERVLRSLALDLESIIPDLAAQQAELDMTASELDAQRARADEATTWIDQAAAATRQMTDGFVERIDRGVPIDRGDRRTPWIDTTTAIEDPSTAPSAIAAALDQAGNEVVLGRTVELANVPIVLDGGARRVHAWRLRVGLIGAAFISEDAATRGIWEGGAAGSPAPWRLDLSEAHAQQIDNLFNVSRERMPPTFVPVPIPYAPVDTDKSAAGEGSERP